MWTNKTKSLANSKHDQLKHTYQYITRNITIKIHQLPHNQTSETHYVTNYLTAKPINRQAYTKLNHFSAVIGFCNAALVLHRANTVL